MLWGVWLEVLRLNLQDNLRALWSDHGRDLIEVTVALAIAFVVWVLVTPENYAPNHRDENRKTRRDNRRINRAVGRIQATYRGNKARGKYEGQPAEQQADE